MNMHMNRAVVVCAILALCVEARAAEGPTAIGALSIGMSEADYIAAIGITPFDCNTSKDSKVLVAETKALSADTKQLCYDFRANKSGTVETVKLKEVSYDLVQADYASSKVIASIGNASKAILLQDRLISLEIYAPKVTLDTLVAKYGTPKLVDKSKLETCQNRMGNEFKHQVGRIEAVWTRGDVRAVLRTQKHPPRNTCTDNYDMQYYVIEDSKAVGMIESAIASLNKDLARTTVKDSPF